MVKDLQYFINAENEFCKEHPNYGELFFDTSIGEMSEQGINDRKHSANPVFPPLKVLPSFA